MTLILGVHLSDRLCLAADTRVTTHEGDGSRRTRDDCLKIEHIARRIAVACAGNVAMVQRLLRAVAKSVSITTGDPVLLRSNLVQIVTPVVDEFLTTGVTYNDARCCLMFAGLTDPQPTRIAPGDFERALRDLRDAAVRNHDSILKQLLDPTEARVVPTLAEALARNAPRLRPGIVDALARRQALDEPLVLPLPGTILFALVVEPPRGLKIVDAAWGSVLAFGSDKLAQTDQDEAFSRMEFSDPDDPTTMKLLLTAIITESAERLKTIGGGVVATFLDQRGLAFMLGRVWADKPPEEGGTLAADLFRRDDAPPPYHMVMRRGGVEHPLTSITQWTSGPDDNLWI